MSDEDYVVLPDAGGLYRERQYTGDMMLSFLAKSDAEARDAAQLILDAMNDAIYGRFHDPRAVRDPYALGWGFKGDFESTSSDGSKRLVRFLDYGEPDVGRGRQRAYSIRVDVDFEANDDSHARSAVSQLQQTLIMGCSRLEKHRCTFEALGLTGHDVAGDREVGLRATLPSTDLGLGF